MPRAKKTAEQKEEAHKASVQVKQEPKARFEFKSWKDYNTYKGEKK